MDIEHNINREQRIQHAIDFLCDIIPHNTSDYWKVVRKYAENYVDWEDEGCPIDEDNPSEISNFMDTELDDLDQIFT